MGVAGEIHACKHKALTTNVTIDVKAMKHLHATVTWCLAIVMAAAACLAAQHAAGQEAQSLSLIIRDNVVRINGREIPKDDLPAALEVRGVDVHYTFNSSDQNEHPLISLNGVLFEITEDGLALVEGEVAKALSSPSPDGAMKKFRITAYAWPQPTLAYQGPAVTPERLAEMAKKTRKASMELENYFTGLSITADAITWQMESLKKASAQVAEAARTMEVLPQMEIIRYLRSLQADENLYGFLEQEFTMESEVLELTSTINRMPYGADREQQLEVLRSKLGSIFELKQENRRREIEKLEAALRALQERLEERSQLREEIIEQRLQELLDNQF